MELGGGAGDNTCKGGDSGSDGDGSRGSGGEGIWGSGKDHGESGNDGGVDTTRSLATSASDHTGVGFGARLESSCHRICRVWWWCAQTHQSSYGGACMAPQGQAHNPERWGLRAASNVWGTSGIQGQLIGTL
ncbi:hypothetical protein Tco_0976736 [Tanacetum coccineum]|uniref:Uncharacterized protein n=1 Tax=Tanacetum coccineum TaxID=301880 RepID=A0ABQ5EI89_9ASTR